MFKMKKFIVTFMMTFSSMFACEERPFEELESYYEQFHIHLGNNVWIEVNDVYKERVLQCVQGLYNLRSLEEIFYTAYEKKWKCPYCYQYWPLGQPCGNKDCPSKY